MSKELIEMNPIGEQYQSPNHANTGVHQARSISCLIKKKCIFPIEISTLQNIQNKSYKNEIHDTGTKLFLRSLKTLNDSDRSVWKSRI